MEVTSQFGTYWEVWTLTVSIWRYFLPQSIVSALPLILAVWGVFSLGRWVGGRNHA